MNKNLRLIRQAQSAGVLFSLVVLSGFLAGGLIVWQSWQLSGVVSRVFLEKQTLSQVLPLLRTVLLVVFLRAVFTAASEALSGRLAVKIKEQLRGELMQKIGRLGPVFLKGERTGELATAALQGLDSLDAYFSQFLPQILLAALLPLTILIVVFPLDPLTGVVFLVTAPLIPIFMVLIGNLSKNHTKRQWLELSRLGAYFLDTLQGLSTLLALGRSKERGREVGRVSERYRSVTMNVLKITFLSAFVLEMISTISTALVAVEIGLRLLYSHIEFQQAFFILLIAPEFYLPLRNLSLRYHAGMTGVTAAGRIFSLLDTPEPNPEEVLPKITDNPFNHHYFLSFRDVSFAYPGNKEFSLKAINLSMETGKHYALVGESGSGKSTLASLLMRFIQPAAGQILIDWTPINNFSVDEWRQKIAWVPQTAKLFNTSLLENVRLYDTKVNREEVFEALRMVGLQGLVTQLPHGLDTSLQERGVRLSGGEARRVALARAFLRNAPILIMDEPTANLDLELETELLDTVRLLQKERTTLTIAHRLGTIASADCIFVLRGGRLVEQGSHADLLTKQGEYMRLLEAARRGL